MEIVIGWPEGIYLILNTIAFARLFMDERLRKAGWFIYLFACHIGGLGILYWGGFFS